MLLTYILTFLIIFVASFTQGFSGFGFALISIPLLSFVVGIKYAVPLGALCGLVINIVLFSRLKKQIDFREIKIILAGSIIGIVPGILLLIYAQPGFLQILLGLIVLAFVFLTYFKLIKPKNIDSRYGYIFGLFSGIFGGAILINGPPILIYFVIKNFDKVKFKATITGFFLITSSIVVIIHLISGITTTDVLIDFSIHLPIVLLGIFLGDYYFNKISSEMYNKFIMAALTIAGILLIIN